MNDHDSETVAGVLRSRGYRQVESPDIASLILYNTCSIREKAAQKVFSRLGEYRTKQAAGQVIGGLGCVAQQEGEDIFARAPWVSLVCGSARYRKLPGLLARVEGGDQRGTGLGNDTEETVETPWRALESEPKLCNHVHLPVQSGSTRVLREMVRTYTREEYLEKIAMLRQAKRPIAITTDIIVGFPGETEADFGETLTLLEEVRYDNMFSFKYSARPNTPSLAMPDAISEEEKSQRLRILQEKQREIQSEHNAKLVNTTFDVLVSGKSRSEERRVGKECRSRWSPYH